MDKTTLGVVSVKFTRHHMPCPSSITQELLCDVFLRARPVLVLGMDRWVT